MSFFMLILFLLTGPAQSDNQQPLSLSVEQAVEMAYQKNYSIQVLAQEIEGLKAQTKIDSAWPDTEIGVDVAGLNFSQTNPQPEKEISFGLTQILPYPGKLKLKSRAGQTLEEEARLNLERQKILLAAEVKKVYYRCQYLNRTLNTLEKNLELLEEIQKNATARYALSTVPFTDILRVRLETARTKNDLLEARREQTSALAELNFLLGREKDAPLYLTTSLEDRTETEQLPGLAEKKKVQSPNLQIARLRQARAEIMGQIADKNRLPDFSLGLFSPSKRWGAAGFSFGLSYPLFSRKRLTGEKELAVAEKQKALIESLAAERFYESRKNQAWNEVRQAEQQVRIFEESLLTDTETEIEKALNDYRLGRLDSLGLLDLFRNASLVKLEYFRALYLYQTSLADWEKAGEDYE